MILRRCEVCGHMHSIPHSERCAMCLGYLLGCVPGDPADDCEVCDGE